MILALQHDLEVERDDRETLLKHLSWLMPVGCRLTAWSVRVTVEIALGNRARLAEESGCRPSIGGAQFGGYSSHTSPSMWRARDATSAFACSARSRLT